MSSPTEKKLGRSPEEKFRTICLSLQTLLFPVLLKTWSREKKEGLQPFNFTGKNSCVGCARVFSIPRSHRVRDEGDSSRPWKRHRGAPSGPPTPATRLPRRLGPPGRRQSGAPRGLGAARLPPPPGPADLRRAGPRSAPASTKRSVRRGRATKGQLRGPGPPRLPPRRAATSARRTIARQKGLASPAAARLLSRGPAAPRSPGPGGGAGPGRQQETGRPVCA